MRYSLTLIMLFMLTACSSMLASKSDADKKNKETAEELYAKASSQMNDVTYADAIKSFETLQSRFPYGRFAQQAQMEIAYAYYKQDEPESALTAVNDFIKQYPKSPSVDYVYYLKGLINFNENQGLFGENYQPNVADLNPKAPRESFDAFKDLVTRFPNSKYAPDAKLRMQYLVNALARHEVKIASYYFRRGAYVAAAARANGVLTEFPQAPATRDALKIMVDSYDAMGMKDLRDDTQRVLDKNVTKDGIKPSAELFPDKTKSWWLFWK